MRALLCLLAACAPNAEYIKPAYELVRESQVLPEDEACRLLSDAMASGNYSAQRRGADTLTGLNNEYQLGVARERVCRITEKRAKRASEIEDERDLVILRSLAWSSGEDDGIRRRAARRLQALLREAQPLDVLQSLAVMLPPTPWPQWYEDMGVEDGIEAKLQTATRSKEEQAQFAEAAQRLEEVKDALTELGSALAENRPVDGLKQTLQSREQSLCRAYLAMAPALKKVLRDGASKQADRLDRCL